MYFESSSTFRPLTIRTLRCLATEGFQLPTDAPTYPRRTESLATMLQKHTPLHCDRWNITDDTSPVTVHGHMNIKNIPNWSKKDVPVTLSTYNQKRTGRFAVINTTDIILMRERQKKHSKHTTITQPRVHPHWNNLNTHYLLRTVRTLRRIKRFYLQPVSYHKRISSVNIL
jgi:hypothetical protein